VYFLLVCLVLLIPPTECVMGFSISISHLLGMYDRVCVLLCDVCFWCMNVMVKFVSDEISEKFLLNYSAISSLWMVF